MIISHSKQCCFFKIPRTGSTSIEALLRLTAGLDYTQDIVMAGHFFPDQHHNVPAAVTPSLDGSPGHMRTHMTPTMAIGFGCLTQAQYNSYQNFCIVRDPVGRMVSAHALGFHSADWDVPAILRDRAVPNMQFALFKPQVEWLTEGNITPLRFSDYENSVNTILTAFGAPIPEDMPNITRRHPAWEQSRMQMATASSTDRTDIERVYSSDAALNT